MEMMFVIGLTDDCWSSLACCHRWHAVIAGMLSSLAVWIADESDPN